MKVIKSRIKTTVTLPGFLLEVALAETWQDTGKSLSESTQHQNDFNGDESSRNEFSSTVHYLIAIHWGRNTAKQAFITYLSRNFTHIVQRREFPLLHQHGFSTTHNLGSNWARR